jgi:hypothetical protein
VASFHLGGGFRPPAEPQNGTATGWSKTQVRVPHPATACGGSNWTDPAAPGSPASGTTDHQGHGPSKGRYSVAVWLR